MKRGGAIAVCVAIIAVVCGFMMQSPEVHVATYPGASGDSWCNSDYAKRIDVNVNNTAGSALTDYQVYVDLTSNPINETSIRVYNATDCTLRPHWCENETGGDCYGQYIKYSALAGSSWTNNTAVYYNDSLADSTSDGFDTFELFDDFERENPTQAYVKSGSNPYWTPANYSWSSEPPDNPQILRDPETGEALQYNGKYWMAYNVQLDSQNNTIGFANSSDLSHWTDMDTNPRLLVNDSDAESWEQTNIMPTELLYMGGQTGVSYDYWLFYAGGTTTGAGNNFKIGIAKSNNMTHWIRDTAHNPIVSWVPAWATGATGVEDFRVQKMSNDSWCSVYEADQMAIHQNHTMIGAAITTTVLPDSGWTDAGRTFSTTTYSFVANPSFIRYDLSDETYYDMLYESSSSGSDARCVGAWVLESDIFTEDAWIRKGEVNVGDETWEEDYSIPNCIIKNNSRYYSFYKAGKGVNGSLGITKSNQSLKYCVQWDIVEGNVAIETASPISDDRSINITRDATKAGGAAAYFFSEKGEHILEAKGKILRADNSCGVVKFSNQSNNQLVSGIFGTTDRLWVQQYGGGANDGNNYTAWASDTGIHTFQLRWQNSRIVSELTDEAISVYYTTSEYSDLTHVQLGGSGTTANADGTIFDDVRVRKYISPEPSATLGSEEEQPETTPAISNVVNGSISATSQYVNATINQSANNIVIYDTGATSATSTACAGQWSDTHACLNASDSNWSSYAESAGALLAYAYFNHTVPAGISQPESLWHVKDAAGHANLTIPSACWGATLYLRATGSDTGNSITWQCDDGPDWTTLRIL